MIIERIIEAKRAKIKQYPCHVNRASELGHVCLRYLVFNRTHWQERTLHDVALQFIFDMGRLVEDAVMDDLKEAGIRVIEQQRAFSWDKYQITGSIDGKIALNENDPNVYPVEIKSMSPNVFNSINTIEDMRKHKYLHVRKYPCQLCLYLLMDNKEKGLFILANKSTGYLKEILVELDYQLGEELIQKAEAINWHIENNTIPNPMPWDDVICPECAFIHICTPDRVGQTLQIIRDDELESYLSRWYELKPFIKEYDEIDETLKKALEGKDKIVIGDFLIEGSYRKKITYDIPKEIKEMYKQESQYWVKKIIKI